MGAQNIEKSHVTQSLDSILNTLFDNETLNLLIKSNPKKFTPLLAKSLLSIVHSMLDSLHELQKQPEFAKVILKIIKAGYLISGN